jgi:hypothetical protein
MEDQMMEELCEDVEVTIVENRPRPGDSCSCNLYCVFWSIIGLMLVAVCMVPIGVVVWSIMETVKYDREYGKYKIDPLKLFKCVHQSLSTNYTQELTEVLKECFMHVIDNG